MKLLLINPRFPESFWSFKWAVDRVLPNKRTLNPPLGLATLAALCPADWEVEIVDENVESLPLDPDANIIGICGMGIQFERQSELLRFYRSKGHFVVAGGSYASLCPEKYESLCDAVVSGEAEYIWPQFCRDFEAGSPKSFYQEKGTVQLKDSPVPRFDLLKIEKYQGVSLQYSRGCPFQCEFCDIIVMFGRVPRTKSPEQVSKELDLLRRLGVHNAFFVDDNLIGNVRQAKDLLRFLDAYQQEHRYKFCFGTEASLNLARDEELLGLFKQANFQWVFIGIESPDEASLRETKKFQNTKQDILGSIQKVYAHGIEISAGMIVGFDNDTVETFEKQFRFITESGIQAAMIGLLTAIPKTPLYDRLKIEGRLLEKDSQDNCKLGTNVMPKRMGYDEMVEGYRLLHQRLLTYRNIAERIRNKLRHLADPVQVSYHSFGDRLKVLWRLLSEGILPGGIPALFQFLKSIPLSRPRLFPIVIQDWIVGLSMRDYVQRHFVDPSAEADPAVESTLRSLEGSLRAYLQGGALELRVARVKNAAANVSITIKGWLDRDFFSRFARHAEVILENTTSSITFHIEEFHAEQRQHLDRLLGRLSRHGDRIRIALSDKARALVEIDSSVFHLLLNRPEPAPRP